MKILNKHSVTISLLSAVLLPASLIAITLAMTSCSGDNKTTDAVEKVKTIETKELNTTKASTEIAEAQVVMNDADKATPSNEILAHGEEELKNHCYKCHTDSVYTREDRVVKSIDALSKQVLRCKEGNNVPWFEEDSDAVVQLLNQKYYRF